MIQIKRNNKVFFTLEDFGEGSKLSYQLMDHHYIILKFTTATPIYFEIGDYVEIPDFGYFELTSSYFPKHNDSDGYDYEMQMDAYYMSWKNKICKYRPQHGANETSFKLTTTVGVHMNVILGNLKALGLTYNGKDFSVDYTTYNNKAFDVQKRFLIEYGSISILDALNSICSEDALNCEWWIDGSIIYLGYCEMEGQTTFEQDVNVLSMSYSESKSTYITRLYAFGSDRNIPKGYFTGADADVTTDGVATDYLMLPNKEVDSDGFYAKDGYIENVNIVKNDKQAIEGVVMFEDEYPKVESAVSSIKTYDSTVDNEDGTNTTQTFWQVTSTDSFTNNFKESWIKSNLTLGIKFTSGALMGMVFDVSFKVIDKVNYFEIVANDTYGRTLPDGVMCPKVGDKYFLFNWDATKITDADLIPTAQLSLFDRAKQYYQKTMISNANFTCTMDGDKFYNNGTYDYHPLGEQVKLINDMFAQVDAKGKHYRNSRIIGMEIPLDIPYDHPQYIVGEKAATSRLGKLEDKVDSITVNGIQISGGNGGGGVYVIGMNDSTPPTDSNVLSARKTTLSFLSKLHNDTAQGVITFIKGLVSEALAKLNGGAYFGNGGALIDEAGRAILESLKSIDYDNEAEQGFAVKKENGKYNAFVTNLTIWGKAIFNQLEVRKLSYAGGNVYLSGAGSKIVKVVPVIWESESSEWIETSVEMCEGWLCYLLADDGTMATQNLWKEGDQVRCRTIGTLATGTMNASNKSYWRTIPEHGVSSVNEKIYDGYGNELYGGQMFSWIVIGKHSLSLDSTTEEFASEEIGGIPEAGDTIVLDGSRSDTTRQGVLILESTGWNTPRIVGFKGVDRYTHETKEVFVLSPDGSRFYSNLFEWVSPSGDTIHMVNYRGEWMAGSYDYYDQVNHNNAMWTCINENGTRQEPSDASSDWQKVLSGEKGDKGDKGDKGENGITWFLTPDTLMYDTGDNGKAINVGTGKKTILRVLRGDKELTDVTIVGVKNMVNCVASRLNNTNSFYISAIAVQKVTLGTDTIDVSCTNGSFDIDFSVDGATYTATAKFAVNVSAFTGRMTLNNRQFEVRMTEVTGNLEKTDKKVDDNYKKLETSISTTAKSVKVEAVSQTKEDMKAAGLEITADGVDLYGEKVKVKNNGKTAAMFTDGKLNAELIDADTINVHHVWAKDSNNQNTLAHFGNYDIDDAKDESNNRYPIWVGSSTASNAPFKVTKDGYMYAEKGSFGVDYDEIDDNGDTVKRYGKFVIGSYDLHCGTLGKTQYMSLSYNQITFGSHNSNGNWINIGHNVVPLPLTNSCASLTIHDSAEYCNIAIYADVRNAPFNYAMIGNGDVVMNGSVFGYQYTRFELNGNILLVNSIKTLTWIVNATKSGSAISLPTLKAINGLLFSGDVPFCIRFTIIADIGSQTFGVYGRNTIKDSTGTQVLNKPEYPLITNWNGNYASDFDMAEGDAYDFLLTYDPNKSYTLGGFTQPYLARIINRQY